MIRLTVACPEALIGDANHLAMVIGEGPGDAQTYRDPAWLDADANRYALACFLARPEWVTAAQSPLTRPAWDADNIVDLDAAERAQAAIGLENPELGPTGNGAARPDRITAIPGVDPAMALALLGLSPATQD